MKFLWQAPAFVIEVHDGDTIKIDLDLGWSIHHKTKVRVEGINCPELGTPAGKEAQAFVAQLLPVGTRVIVTCTRYDKYGRSQARVMLPTGGNLGDRIVAAGHAVAVAGYTSGE